MKLFAAGAGLSELGACLAQGLCEGVVVDAASLAGAPDGGAALRALCGPDRVVLVELPPEVRDAEAIVRAARAADAPIVVRVPFGGDAVKVLRACKAAGVATNAVGCATALEAHAAARAGAAWISPVLATAGGRHGATPLDEIRKMRALLKADDLTARILVGPVPSVGALVELAVVSVHAALVSPAVLRELSARRGEASRSAGAARVAAEG
jgi:hypothetical protein